MRKLFIKSMTLGAAMLGLSFLTPAAKALNFVPQSEGEINVGLGSSLAGSYLDVSSLFSSIVSEVDSTTGTRSRLFVDKAGTANNYGSIFFQTFDTGTSEEQDNFWLRPVAMRNETTPLTENGQLEVGTFTFNFAQPLEKLLIRWFDTEDVGTGILSVNGIALNEFVTPGANKNIFEQMLTNVNSITLKFGNAQSSVIPSTGDGVLAQFEGTPVASVPEPGMTLGLAAIAGGGFLNWSRRKKKATLS